MANKPLFMRHLSVSLVPNLGKTTRSPQSDLTSWILTLNLGQTPLILACRTGNLPLVKILYEYGQQNWEWTKDNSGSTPLHMSALFGHLDICQFLIERQSGILRDFQFKSRFKESHTAFFHQICFMGRYLKYIYQPSEWK